MSKPTKPGWYWWRHPIGLFDYEAVNVKNGAGDRLFFDTMYETLWIDEIESEWGDAVFPQGTFAELMTIWGMLDSYENHTDICNARDRIGKLIDDYMPLSEDELKEIFEVQK